MEKQTQQDAFSLVANSMPEACERINAFSSEVLRTRGGRIGSGMGGLLEALWGYQINNVITEREDTCCELAWFPDHQFHDFACITRDADWEPSTGHGELFRIEAKSMNVDADESKAHFDVLESKLGEFDALVVLVWQWANVDKNRRYPKIIDSFFGLASTLVKLRDALHLARGGTFVDKQNCPDGCSTNTCSHHGEPLNKNGKRERLSGPKNARPSTISYAANFGGLVRMLRTSGSYAKQEFRKIRRAYRCADRYISFIHRNYPTEEQNHYYAKEWRTIASRLGINNPTNKNIPDLCNEIRIHKDYEELLRELD